MTYSRQACWIECKISPLTRTNPPKHSTSVKYCYKQFYSIMIKRCCCCCCCCFVFGFVLLFRLFHPFFPCFLLQMHVLNVLSLLIQRIGDKVSITPLFFLYLPLDLENNLYFKQLVISNTWTYRFTVRLVMSNKLERCYFIVFIKVRPFAASLSQYLPELWQESGDHNMLRCAIVSTMTHLVEVSKFF